MIENTDKGLVTFQIDTAQLVYGGFKCHDYVNRYPGRFANWHLKDANADGKGSTEMGRNRRLQILIRCGGESRIRGLLH